jgi:magnesium-transporting ATPase (P-type)
VLHTFDFSPELARMCTVVEMEESGERLALVKGAPESVAALCDPSTVPEDFLARAPGLSSAPRLPLNRARGARLLNRFDEAPRGR